MSGPVQHDGAWWTQREDGSWLKWSQERGAWEPYSAGPPPPGPSPGPPGAPPAAPQRPSGYPPPAVRQPPAGYPSLAEWWQRAVALVLDGLILGIPIALLAIPFFASFVSSVEDVPPGQTPDIGPFVGFYVLGTLLLTVLQGAYFTYLHGRPQGQTLGKMLMNIKVVDEGTGSSVGYGRAFLRYLMTIVFSFGCGIVSLLDYLWPLWDDRRQSLHDKIAKSLVVRV